MVDTVGTSTSWISVAGPSLDELAEELGVVRTAQAPSQRGSAFEAATLEDGWVLFLEKLKRNGVVAGPQVLEQLSRRWRVVGCDEESHVMYSASSEWRDGREVWALVHAAENGIEHLEVRGSPPENWMLVRDEHLEQQERAGDENVDYVYEIPLVVAQRVVGYRLETEMDDQLDFIPLIKAPAGSASKPWWKLW
jgi:hypothetical protein